MKEKRYSNIPHIISPKEKRKKKKAIYQVKGCKDARAVRYEPFIYPCFFVSPELTFAALFYSFGLINSTDATLGVVVGATEGKTTQQRFDKTFAAAFRAGKQLFKKLWFSRGGILSGFLICCLSALAWVGECGLSGYFA